MILEPNYYDVVIIGSGGAGLRAAVSAAEGGARTLIVAKGKVNRSGCTLLAGANLSADIACDGKSLSEMGITDANKFDTRDLWFQDTVHEGFYLNNQELVQVFVDEAADCIRELISWGMEILGTEGERGIAVFGSAILDALYKRIRELDIDIMEDTFCTDIVTEQNEVRGTVLVDIISGDILYVQTSAVVIATGGSHNLFSENSGPTDCCGEGQAIALRAGAELIDMEMISFCPTVIKEPRMYKGNILPYIINTTGFGSLLNKFGNCFTTRHLSQKVEMLAMETEWNKMLLSYAIQCEVNEGRGNMYGGIYFVLNSHPQELVKELYNQFPSLNTGIYSDIMSYLLNDHALTVAPFAHYFEGGIRINKYMQTKVIGLYAAGECAGGLFGSNRVSAATTEMLVEGKIAGKNAAGYAVGNKKNLTCYDTLNKLEADLIIPFTRRSNQNVVQIRTEMCQTMQTSLHIIRDEETLEIAEKQISELILRLRNVSILETSRVYNKQWLDYLQIRNSLITASTILRSAKLRKESRGVHIRRDYFYTDNKNFLNNIIIENINLDYRMEKPVVTTLCLDDYQKHDYLQYIEEVIKRLS